MKNSARIKFVDLAEKRVNRAIKDIKLIGNLSNKSNYSYSDNDSKKIHLALKKAVEEMKLRFDSSEGSTHNSFKL